MMDQSSSLPASRRLWNMLQGSLTTWKIIFWKGHIPILSLSLPQGMHIPSTRMKVWRSSMIVTIGNRALPISNKSKPDASPPGTPANNRKTKKQKLKPAAGALDFTKAGLFHCANETPASDLFLSDLSKPLYGYFCFRNKKCTKPNQACNFNQIRKWDEIPAEDQVKILAHCHLSDGKKSGLTRLCSQSSGRLSLISFLIS